MLPDGEASRTEYDAELGGEKVRLDLSMKAMREIKKKTKLSVSRGGFFSEATEEEMIQFLIIAGRKHHSDLITEDWILEEVGLADCIGCITGVVSYLREQGVLPEDPEEKN